jgi:dUTP pyrophosphatase
MGGLRKKVMVEARGRHISRTGADMPRSPVVKITGNYIPMYLTAQSSGCDLCARIKRPVAIEPGEIAVVGTGIRIALPPGYEAQVRPRSGLAKDHGIGILNAPGTIDADYRGEVKVILFNFGKRSFTVRHNDRIAQMVFCRVAQADFKTVQRLPTTRRGAGGFGHSGIKGRR